MTEDTVSRPDPMTRSDPTSQYELWDDTDGNVIGIYATLQDLVGATFALGQANPKADPFLAALTHRAAIEGAPHDPE